MSTCKGCGAKIVWGRTEDGKNIPLDAKAPVYELLVEGTTLCRRAPRVFLVSHFATCPDANKFSASNKEKG